MQVLGLFVTVLALCTAQSVVDKASSSSNAPSQYRVAFLPGGACVSWYTPSEPTATPSVLYGLSASNLTMSATGVYHTYGTGWFSDVILPDLEPHTTYYYQVNGTTRTPAFVTARAPGDTSTFKFLMVGDMGIDNSADTIKQMTKEVPDVDFIHHVGDLSYADDWATRHDTYEGTWNTWQEEIDPISSQRAYMVLPGNHEATCSEEDPKSCASMTRNFTSYRNRFRMPWLESGGIDNMWYSWDYGLMHFANIDTETDYPKSPEGQGSSINAGPFGNQLAWLAQDLETANANRAQVPWIIVSGHRPVYSSGGGDYSMTRDAFEDLLLKYNVDIFFAGHVHWYERTWPLGKDAKIEQKNYNYPSDPIYIVNGAAGNVEGHTTGKAKDYTSFLNDKDYGYGKVEVYNATTLKWKFHKATDGTLVDEIVINKKR